ncbi:hypothetical protein CPB86DRAFT_711415 [Serendipita vermifera]|nr:hypothetical protein CPB86DRAFT_711415 [Serendipita vermifera]
MSARVQSLPTNIDFSTRPQVDVVSPTYGGRQVAPNPIAHPRTSTQGPSSSSFIDSTLPIRPFGFGLPSPPSEPDDNDVLPIIHSSSVDSLLRSRIAEAAIASAAHEPDAEAAFFVADLGQIYRQHIKWQKHLPNVTPFYAVKANPDPVVLGLLAALGAGFDCASMNEINMVAQLGVNPSRVIFANPCKPTSYVKHAARNGVDMTTFDNVDELHKVARVHPGAKLVLRILTDDSKAVCRLGLKFGAPLVAVPTLLAKAKELSLNVIGISFHVGSGCYDTGAFADAIARARKAFDMGREAGYEFSLLDVGGGFEDERFEEAASVIGDALREHFSGSNIQIIAEPGRYYVAEAFTLATNIIARRGPDRAVLEAAADDDNPKVMYYMNDGVYSSFNCIMFDHQTVSPFCLTVGKVLVDAPTPLDTQEQDSPPVSVMSSLWGPTCDAIDCVLAKVKLPAALEVGDWLGFRKMGAYTICAASSFNGFDRTKVVYTTGEELAVQKLVS